MLGVSRQPRRRGEQQGLASGCFEQRDCTVHRGVLLQGAEACVAATMAAIPPIFKALAQAGLNAWRPYKQRAREDHAPHHYWATRPPGRSGGANYRSILKLYMSEGWGRATKTEVGYCVRFIRENGRRWSWRGSLERYLRERKESLEVWINIFLHQHLLARSLMYTL